MHTCVETEDVGSDFRMTKSIILSCFPMEDEKKKKKNVRLCSAQQLFNASWGIMSL